MKKIKIFLTVLCMGSLVFFMMASASADIILEPDDADYYGSDPNNPDSGDIPGIVGYVGTLRLLYKQNVEGPEEGPFDSSYDTTFYNTPSDPMDATITYVAGTPISGDPLYLLVKDGNHDPIWYIFDLTGWDGMETIILEDFWPDQGAISHVSIYGPTTSVPEPTTILLIGSGLIGLWAFRRKFKK